MKILYLHQHFATPKMPGITRSYEFAKRLVRAGHEVHLIAADQSSPPTTNECSQTIEDGITIYWLPIPYNNKMGFYSRIYAFLKYAVLAAKLGIRIKSDIIYASSPPLTATLPAIYLSKKKRIPLTLEVRDLWPELPIAFGALKNKLLIRLAFLLEKFAYQSANHIVALSPGMKLGISKTGYPSENITVIPNCCDHELFRLSETSLQNFRKAHPFLKNNPFALYAGTLGEANGVAYIAHLAHCFLKRNHPFCFLVIGDGKETSLVRDTAARLGVLDKNFFMLPLLPKEEVPTAFVAATIILNTLVDKRALWNSSPNKFFDALAAGRPIAINFDGWLANLLRSSQAGLVLDPKNYDRATDTLMAKLADPEWLKTAPKNAAKLGSEQFSREKLFEDLEATLLKTAGLNPQPQIVVKKSKI